MLIGLNTGGSPRFTTSDLVIRGPGPTYITVREAEGKKICKINGKILQRWQAGKSAVVRRTRTQLHSVYLSGEGYGAGGEDAALEVLRSQREAREPRD